MTKFFVALVLLTTWPTALCAQSFSSGKSLHELRRSVYAETKQPLRQHPYRLPQQPEPMPLSPTFLPRWTSDDLPFFCKIEHKMGRRMAVPLKFRLGSVEYVDRLEYPGRWGVQPD